MQAQPVTKTELYNRQAIRRMDTQTENFERPLSADSDEPDYLDTDIPPRWRVSDRANRERLKDYMRRLNTALNAEPVA